MKKVIIAALALCLVAFGTYKFVNSENDNDVKTVSKNSTVNYGNVTAGVTESSSISIDNLSQSYDLTLTSANVSASISGENSSNLGNQQQGGNNQGNAMGNSGAGTSGSTSVTATSSTSSISLIIDEVCVSAGQTVAKGDSLMSITDESISDARAELEKAVDSTKLALTQAKIDEQTTTLEAQYDYDTRITEGEYAEQKYNSTLESITSNISLLKSEISEIESEISSLETEIASANEQQTSQLEKQLSQLETELENYKAQLSSAKSTQSADSLAAKQEYEQAIIYYNNAQSLYDIAVSDVDDTTSSAQDDYDTAKENLEKFEEYVADETIKADYSGIISSVNYVTGDTLSSEISIVDYADASAITVTVSVTEDDISAVNLEDIVDIDFLAYPDETYEGYISEIGSSTSTSSTVSYPVTIVITTYPDTILTGMTANVTFITKQVSDVLYVSNKAITTEGAKSYVKILNDDGSYKKVQVSTGFSDGSNVEISGDISTGDTIVIESKVKNQ